MMNRRGFIESTGALLALAAAPRRGLAQRARPPRIGYLLLSPVTDLPSRERQAFLDGLRELGYVPGKSVEIVYRSAESEPLFMDEVAQDLVKLGVDVIVAAGTLAILSAIKATRKVPIVMLAQGDPVGVGAVSSLARPEGNVTGVSFISSDLAPKRVQLIKELVPHAKRIAIMWDTRNANARNEAAATVTAARALGMEPESLGLSSDAQLARTLEMLARRRPDVLYAAFEGGLVGSNRTIIAEFGVRHRMPVVSGWSFLSEAGGLMSYAPDIPAMFHRAAFYVHRVLQGEKPQALPIELPTRVELVINLRTARTLGLAVPHSLLLRADRVIE